MDLEKWKIILSTKRQDGAYYEASNLGNVRRIGSPLKFNVSPNSYLMVSVPVPAHGDHYPALVHRLVAEAFLGAPPPRARVRHKNRNPADNRVENLEYVLPNRDVISYPGQEEKIESAFITSPTSLDTAFRIWAAGFFDGEGHASIVKNKKGKVRKNNSYVLEAGVANTEVSLVEPFLQEFGGHIGVDTHDRWKTCFKWKASARKAAKFLSFVEPYVRDPRRREIIALALRFQAHQHHKFPGQTGEASLEYRAEQERFWLQMRELNRRGKASQ